MVMTSSMPNTATNGTRRDILTSVSVNDMQSLLSGRAQLTKTLGDFSCANLPLAWIQLVLASDRELNLQHRSFCGRLQQRLRILSWITFTEHGVARHQNFCTRTNHVGDRIEPHTAIDLDPVMQARAGCEFPPTAAFCGR